MVRFGLIGDVHGEDALLATTLQAFATAKVDRILCTGDVVDGHGDVDRSCRLLREAGAAVVRGNHDRWIRADEMRTLPLATRMTDLAVETIGWLKELPRTLSFPLPTGGRLLLCHGVGENDMNRLLPDDRGYAIASNDDLLKLLFDLEVHVMVGGHTHYPMARRFERAKGKPPLFVVNPGTLAREHDPGFALLEIGATSVAVELYRLGPGAPTLHRTITL